MSLLKNVSSLLIALFLLLGQASSQDKVALQNERSQLNNKIELTSKLLQETQSQKSNTQQSLVLLNKKLNYRNLLIKNYSKESRELERQIKSNEEEITDLEGELNKLKDEYAHLIVQAYKNRDSYDQIMFIFSAQSFNQAYKRMKFIQEYTQYRHKQAEVIKIKSNELLNLNASLETQIQESRSLKGQVEKEKKDLEGDANEKKKVLSSLQQDEKELRKQLKEQEKQRKKLNKEIDRIIAEEIKKTKKDNKGNFELTPEAQQLSDSFAKNKGKLPWPVEKGVVTGAFGIHNHPTLPGIKVENNGVDIATESGSSVRSVFNGTVSAVLDFQNSGKAVIINHGAYRTVYSNLKDVFVDKGQVVDTKQFIGTVLSNKKNGKTESHFEILYINSKGEFIKQNPALWIAR